MPEYPKMEVSKEQEFYPWLVSLPNSQVEELGMDLLILMFDIVNASRPAEISKRSCIMADLISS
jgi:hypothetical protein